MTSSVICQDIKNKVLFLAWLLLRKPKMETPTISSSLTTVLFQLWFSESSNHMTENLAPDSPHLLYHTPQWLPGHLCSTWEPDCDSAPDQLCPRFQTWLLCRPNIPSESGRQLQGHKAEEPMTNGPVGTELHKNVLVRRQSFKTNAGDTHRRITWLT